MGRKRMREYDITKPPDNTESAPPISTKLPSVPESVLKNRRRRDASKAARLQNMLKTRAQKWKKSKDYFKRAEIFVKEFRAKEKDEKRLLRIIKEPKETVVPNAPLEEKLGFVIRIKGAIKMSPKVIKVLNLLRLKSSNTGVFLKFNEATLLMMKICEPYLTWGLPNLKSIRELIYKRGFVKVDNKRTPITSNEIIEKALGKFNIICMEDLIHEIFTLGANFNEAVNFLWSFKLNSPAGGWRVRHISFEHGGDYGCRQEKINELLRKMV